MADTEDVKDRLHRVTSTCPGQWLYLLGDEGVVYSEAQNRFAGLDAVGVSAYRAFDAGARVEDLSGFGHPSHSLPAWVNRLEAVYALSQGNFPAEKPRLEWPVLESARTANVEIHGIPVCLEYPIGPLENLCRDYVLNCPATAQPARCHLLARHAGDGWAIDGNGCELLSGLRDEQIGLGLLHAVRSLLYAEAEYDVAFHAAMVADRNRGILLSAPREAGKSTLAAYLAARGFELLTDEPTLLHLDTYSVSPLRLPISLKEGSWDMLRQDWPQLVGTPMHVRSDGTRIRLLHLPPQSVVSRRLTHIVFPEYCPSSVAHKERVSPLPALSLLNEGGMLLAEHAARETFEAFLEFVCRTPAYAVRYAALEEAERMLSGLTV